ncbi:Cmc1 domain containing protein [Asbolus verrucosus]|uniref:COX assembly mitochondrial protein n=1 Tax=Asbolus verrucosus TaxID=1661398 RepID=A0A482V8S8_ASBVE|nr:Cmc1 domain containing protein [Asbolus verrucosus]
MHTDLSPHLHGEQCNDLIKILRDCHAEHPFGKFIGFCNGADSAMTRCLKEERLKRRQRNYEKSMETKRKLQHLFEQERKHSQNNTNS